MLPIALVFILILVVVRFSGVLTLTQIEAWLINVKNISPIYLALLVILLLFCDLFVTIPTFGITVLAGFFLGFFWGGLAALTGILLAGVCGYTLCRYYGDSILNTIVKDQKQKKEATKAFQKHGVVMILVSRSVPMLPEISACLAGMTKMPFRRFLPAWLLGNGLFLFIAAYAGSVSTIEDPKPAIFAAIGTSVLLWGSWFFYRKKLKNQ